MAEMTLVIDPDGSSFALHDRANGRWMTAFSAPVPETKSQWASSIDTEGDRRAVLGYVNRTITVTVNLQKSTAALLQALENDLGEKIWKLAREGGVLELSTPAGTSISFDVEEASMQRVWEPAHVVMHLAVYQVTFVCRPFGTAAETDLGDNTETTLPVLVFTEATVAGDVDGDGRLLVDNDASADWKWVGWGIEQDRDYTFTDSSGSGALFYEAESRTALGGAAATAIAGASGGTVVRQGTLTTEYQAMLSTQASGGGAHLSHVGDFNVWAELQMPTSNTGAVTVALEWSQGDFLRRTTNTPVEFEANHGREGEWVFQRLGQVSIPAVPTGSQRWEGRIIAKSTVDGDDLYVDHLVLMPTKFGSGEAAAVDRPFTPTSFSAQDAFTSTTAGNALNGRTATAGGSWATSGSATDLVFADAAGSMTTEHITRTATGTRYAVLGTTNFTNVHITGTVLVTGGGDKAGFMARWTDSSNHLHAYAEVDSSDATTSINIATVVSGSSTVLATEDIGTQSVPLTLKLTVFASGDATLQAFSSAGALLGTIECSSTVLATGGTLATGEPGFIDVGGSGAARSYDDLRVSVPPVDAAAFAGQSIDVRSDGVIREDASGTFWNPVSSYLGDYLRVPPSGAEGRSVRVIVKPCRNHPDTGIDAAIDDISAHLFVTGRYWVVPA